MQGSRGDDLATPGLSLDNLIELGRAAAAAGGLRPEWPMGGRRQAIRLWVRLRARLPLRGVWHGLRLLARFLEMPALLMLRDHALLADPFRSRGGVRAHRERRRRTSRRGCDSRGRRPDLRPVCFRFWTVCVHWCLPPPVPVGGAVRPATMTWITSDCAGMLLMLSIVQTTRRARFIRKPAVHHASGVCGPCRSLLAGIGMTLLKPWNPADPVEPAVATVCGDVRWNPTLPGCDSSFPRRTSV